MNILTRYALATSIVLLVAITLFAHVTSSAMQRFYLEEAVKDAETLSETIIRTTHHSMIENDLKSVYQMIQEVGKQKGVDHVRLVNKDGVITFSTIPEEINTRIDKDAESCNVCHFSKAALTEAPSMNRSRRYVDRTGAEVLGLATGIYNDPVCFNASCHFHPSGTKILGVLDVILPLQAMHVQARQFRDNFIVLTVIMLFSLFLILVLITHTYIKEPIRRLVNHTREVAFGNLDARLGKLSHGELEELGTAFDEMTRSLQRSQLEVKQWAASLEDRVEQRTEEIRTIQAQLIHSERLASIGELTAGIAHEINNPLTGITIFSSLLLANPKLNPELKPDLETILGETRRCADIVRRLLEFSRESKPHMDRESVQTILEGTLALVERQTIFHNIRIERSYEPNLPEVLVDHDQIMQVFMNILLNAGQSMGNKGMLTLATGFDVAQGFLRVTIADTGCGIAEENLSRIFDPFFSTKGAQGTGLGLSVSFGIIKNHGGRIEVRSRVGEGTAFIIWLPGEGQK